MTVYFWKSTFPLFCILLIEAMSYGIVAPVLAPMLLEPSSEFLSQDTPLTLRTFYYSLALGLPMAFMFFGAPLLGDISDYLGRKKTLLIALIGIAVSCFISAFGIIFGSVFLLLSGRAILGLMDGSESVAKAAIADISCSAKQKVINLSLASFAGTVGFVFGPALGGFVSNPSWNSSFGYTTPFLVAAVLALFNALFLYYLFAETYEPKERKKIRVLSSFQNLAIAFTEKKIRVLAAVFFCMQFCWGMYFQTVPILLVKELHYTPEKIGIFLSYIGVCFAVTLAVVIRILLNFLSQRQIVIVSLALIFMGSCIIAFIQQKTAIWLSVIPICLGVGLSYNTVLSLFSDSVNKDQQGRVMGVAVGLFSIAWVISSMLGGYLSSTYLYAPYIAMSVVGLIGYVMAFWVEK